MNERTTLDPELRRFILARENQQRRERAALENIDPFMPDVLSPREEEELLQKGLEAIQTTDIECSPECRCRPQPVAYRYVKPPAPVASILTHKFHNGKLWFYCQLNTDKSNPEYRRQCQVTTEMRLEYITRLKAQGRVLREDEVWTAGDEAAVRAAVYPALTAKQKATNEQVVNCQDTNEWDHETNNGIVMKKIRGKKPVDGNKEGPAVVEEGKELYAVERILGASMENKKVWYLIKWWGWDTSHNSWEPYSALNGVADALKIFRKECGKPTQENPRVLTQEGRDFERWQKMKAASDARNRSISVIPGKRPVSATRQSHSSSNSKRSKKSSSRKSRAASPMEEGDSGSESVGSVPGENEYYIDRIIGALWQTGTSKMWFLIRWEGYGLDQCSWECEDALIGKCDAVAEFYLRMGKPDWNIPKILDADGKEFDRLVGEEERQLLKKNRRS